MFYEKLFVEKSLRIWQFYAGQLLNTSVYPGIWRPKIGYACAYANASSSHDTYIHEMARLKSID